MHTTTPPPRSPTHPYLHLQAQTSTVSTSSSGTIRVLPNDINSAETLRVLPNDINSAETLRVLPRLPYHFDDDGDDVNVDANSHINADNNTDVEAENSDTDTNSNIGTGREQEEEEQEEEEEYYIPPGASSRIDYIDPTTGELKYPHCWEDTKSFDNHPNRARHMFIVGLVFVVFTAVLGYLVKKNGGRRGMINDLEGEKGDWDGEDEEGLAMGGCFTGHIVTVLLQIYIDDNSGKYFIPTINFGTLCQLHQILDMLRPKFQLQTEKGTRYVVHSMFVTWMRILMGISVVTVAFMVIVIVIVGFEMGKSMMRTLKNG
ncbi:hypothetical protein BZA77DRAFT_290702 [Pyronema omphalodes]|nr:hypothetical protein BZA77DRAFT_290702 [Pyronema omphalodes]